jgi:hypothetical protein
MINYEFTRVLSFLTDAILMLNYSSNLKLKILYHLVQIFISSILSSQVS